MTNHELARSLDTSHEWIVARTGIHERHVAAENENTSTIGAEAARRALDSAGIGIADVDAIICATSTPDCLTPATACLIHEQLGDHGAFAFDVSAGCTGFLYAFRAARALIADQAAETVLVIGAETMSRVVDWQVRETCVLFGDGAGALLLQARAQGGGVQACTLGSDGSKAPLISIGIGTRRHEADDPRPIGRRPYVEIEGRQVFAFAARILAESIESVAAETGACLDEIDLLIPHQANQRIIEAAARRLDIDPARVYSNMAHTANTAAASIPIAIAEAAECGRLTTGDRVALSGFGSGLTWGAALIDWTGRSPEMPPVVQAGLATRQANDRAMSLTGRG